MGEGQIMQRADALHIVRVTIEADSPLSVGSGESRSETRREARSAKEETVTVAEVQRDANLLPAIPGSGMQGVLRRLAAEVHGEKFAAAMFGREDADGKGDAGRVACGWTCAHDKNGRAVCGLRLDGLYGDSVLELLKRPEPLWRDHVALNDRHSVDCRRKFARAAVPVGARFSLELSGWGDDSFLNKLRMIVRLFRHPRLRLGAGSGRGYGRIRLLAASRKEAPLNDAKVLHKLRRQPPSEMFDTDVLEELRELDSSGAPASEDEDTVLHLSLKCSDLLRIGSQGPHAQTLTHSAQRARSASTGELVKCHALGRPDDSKRANAVLKLLREPRIAWENDRGRAIGIEEEPEEDSVPVEQLRFPVPGSSIRGPLAHRMLFHANCLSGMCINADEWRGKCEQERKDLEKTYGGYAKRSPEIAAFLGEAKEDDTGQAGRVLFNDAEACGAGWIVGIDHVSIDRFTGGALDGALFREDALLGGRIDATVIIRSPPEPVSKGVGGWPKETATAFLLAVRDLCNGRLVLGGRGHGECSGTACFEGKHAGEWQGAAQVACVPARDAKA